MVLVFDSKGKLVRKLGYDEARDPGEFAAFLKQVK